jgi:glyoxylase-like metal-dependent hydrolase (beta-lactamase superfamily II)
MTTPMLPRCPGDSSSVIYPFSVGRLSCAVISDGQPGPPLLPPLAAFFTPGAGVPQAELQNAIAAEEPRRTTLTCGYNCLLVRTPAGDAVVDTGLGARFLGYGPQIEPLVGQLAGHLAEAGSAPSGIAAVVFSHLHQDHSRGAAWSGELTFPAAAGFAHAAEIAFWAGEAGPATDDPHVESAREAIRLLGSRLRAFEYDSEILPGVRTIGAAGHTPGHTALLVESGGERLLCLADTFYDPLQLSHPHWSTPWDHDAARAVASRRRLLDLAAAEQLLVHAYHLPFPGLGQVRRQAGGYRWDPLPASQARG